MFNQNRSPQRHRKIPFCPVACADHGKISLLMQMIIHNVDVWNGTVLKISWLSILWYPLQGLTGINGAGHGVVVVRCGAKGRIVSLSLHLFPPFILLVLLLVLLKTDITHWNNACEVLSRCTFSSGKETCFLVNICFPSAAGWTQVWGGWSEGSSPFCDIPHF